MNCSYWNQPVIRDKPLLAPENFLSLPPVTRIDNNENASVSIWQGSGFWIKDLPVHCWWYDETIVCQNCKKENTVAVYLNNDVSQTGKIMKLETYCRDCKKINFWDGYD